MKIRKGFVSNSSTSSFILTNISEEEKTLSDFIKEIEFIYVNDGLSFDEALSSLTNDETLYPGESLDIWGDMGDHYYTGAGPLWKASLESLTYHCIYRTKSFTWNVGRNG